MKILVVILLAYSVVFAQNSINYCKFSYPIDNEDYQKFGFITYSSGEGIGPKSIAIDSDYVYITDTYHNNIKKINILSGKLISGKPISRKRRIFLRDIAVYNNKVIVSNDLDGIYVLNKNLKLEKKITAERGTKFFKKTNDSLFIYIDIDKKYLFKNDTILFCGNERKYLIPYLTHWKKFEEVEKSDHILFVSDSLEIKLQEKVPKLYYYYDALNIEYTKNILVCFGIENNEFILQIYRK